VERGRAFAALAALLDASEGELMERPLLLVVEDVQWLDARSLEVLERLLPLARELPVLMIATARPGAVASRLEAAMQSALGDAGVAIALGPLDRESAGALALTALGAAADAETVALVMERGGGLPGPLLQAAFLAPALRSEREQANQRADRTTEAERRRAVVVFADITGFTAMTERAGAEAAYPVVAACLEILDEVAREYGGTVDHYLGDCVMALFGVPRALEDAPRAALNAAIDMRRRIRLPRRHDAGADRRASAWPWPGIASDIP
jgi:hypothetical protein